MTEFNVYCICFVLQRMAACNRPPSKTGGKLIHSLPIKGVHFSGNIIDSVLLRTEYRNGQLYSATFTY